MSPYTRPLLGVFVLVVVCVNKPIQGGAALGFFLGEKLLHARVAGFAPLGRVIDGQLQGGALGIDVR